MSTPSLAGGKIIDVRFDEEDQHGNLIEFGAIIREETRLQGQCRVGAYSIINGATLYRNTTIGRYCSVARHSAIGAQNHPAHCLGTSLVLGGTAASLIRLATVVGNDVWIGANAVVRSGLTVGDGAIIGAGAVVTHDVEPYAIVVGVPAKKLRLRFPPAICQELLELRWWELQHEVIASLPHGDIGECIYRLRNLRRPNSPQ